MDGSDLQRFPVDAHPSDLQPRSLSSLADDASTLAAAQQEQPQPQPEQQQQQQQHPHPHHQQSHQTHTQDLADSRDAPSLQPLQSALEHQELHAHRQQEHRHLHNVEHHLDTTPAFMRPVRTGEPVGPVLMSSQLFHQKPSSYEEVSRAQAFAADHSGNGQHILPSLAHGVDQDVHPSQALSQGRSDRPDTVVMDQGHDNGADGMDDDARTAGLPLSQSFQQCLQMQQPGDGYTIASELAKQETGLKDMKLVPDPPDLEYWREKLFNVDDMITLTEDQFRTYFPHVDNVYSHRSTQRYKRKPFVSHYWDCRLKGRPPGTPKSDDPNKKKRKRTARQRDLCDVKIKITEYFPGYGVAAASDFSGTCPADSSFPPAEFLPSVNSLFSSETSVGQRRDSQPFGVLTPNPTLPEGHPGANGERFFTIQRVNGNGANGKNDGVSGGHRHTLDESDRVKKNSVQRYLLKEAREKKKAVTVSWIPSIFFHRLTMPQSQTQQKTYHTKATGLAALTAINHSKEAELQLFGSCFCPFVQRVWIALEIKGIPYQYIEVDPYQKPQSLLEVNPRGLVPALRHGDWGSYESSVLLEYLEDLHVGPPLLPPGDAKLRAHCRLWTDHINRHIVPSFYRVLQEQEEARQSTNVQELQDGLRTLIAAADPEGPFFLGSNISFVDVQIAPWILRFSRVLKPYRGWPEPEAGSRWAAWVNAIEVNEHVKATTSSDELYLDSYERYARKYIIAELSSRDD
ncbi:glutathione S-transferase family protein [Aspergillus clavatus NRRL 1]|uniref:Glutathione transferase, putative n=1 Tax=Aspergillus clavatus (strain ATCC 1007 / CBS 513.65 / DSM 816 / NCTC 3887 / NRRL 1 / QM 1276 / 107) TaxID=344612 RepID=A1CIA5_ASPCL|nr:glutathione transferase, putative [Aspergillus clavatus NRRL 1]EAW10610.1 glutathione transferase, putative [Aspergillus clavatus NRRL 1]